MVKKQVICDAECLRASKLRKPRPEEERPPGGLAGVCRFLGDPRGGLAAFFPSVTVSCGSAPAGL